MSKFINNGYNRKLYTIEIEQNNSIFYQQYEGCIKGYSHIKQYNDMDHVILLFPSTTPIIINPLDVQIQYYQKLYNKMKVL